MSNENIVNDIVKKCSGPVSVFLGAGASMPIGLPDMVSFWENAYGSDFFETVGQRCDYSLNSNSKLTGAQITQNKNSIIRRLIQTASIGKGRISCDLEELFDYIHNCPILSSSPINLEALKRSFYLYHTCANGAYSTRDFTNYTQHYGSFRASTTTWINDTLGCIEELRRKLYESYLIDDSDQWESNVSEAVNCYSIFPKIFKGNSDSIVFTTNYDTVFDSLEVAGKLKTVGYRLHNGTALNPEKRRYFFSLENYLEGTEDTLPSLVLFRMHGSVAWERKDESIEDHFPNKHNSRAEIVEPVVSKKLPETDPFRGMYDIFKKVLQSNKVLISIGFSFRDDAIRTIVEDELRRDSTFKVICVAPPCEKVPELDNFMAKLENDFADRFIWMKERFGTSETAQKIQSIIDECLT